MQSITVDRDRRIEIPEEFSLQLGIVEGVTLTATVVDGAIVLKPSLRPRRKGDLDQRRELIDELIAHTASLPVLDDRSPDDILYDDDGHLK